MTWNGNQWWFYDGQLPSIGNDTVVWFMSSSSSVHSALLFPEWMAFRKCAVPHVGLLAEYFRLRIDPDVDINSHRSVLRHLVPVQASNANVNLSHSHLLHLAGCSRSLFAVRSLCHHHYLREPNLLWGELGQQIISTGNFIFLLIS